MNTLAPIVLFVYKRLYHTKKTVASLLQNDQSKESELYIFSDGFKSSSDYNQVNEVRKYINSITGFKKIDIVERDKNVGLAKSVISGASQILRKYKKIIVMEDDLICSRNFLKFINEALEFYTNNLKVYSVTGYTFPIKFPQPYTSDVYFSPRPSSWGWGTWQDRWEKVDWQVKDFNDFIKDKEAVLQFNRGGNDLTNMLKKHMLKKNDSWAITWSYAHFRQKAFCLYPVKSKILNIGNDSSGTHVKRTNKYQSELDKGETNYYFPDNVILNDKLLDNFQKFFNKNLIARFYRQLCNIILKD